MGYYKKIDLKETQMKILVACSETNNRFNDGYTQFEIKKELYELKWILDEYFAKAPKFVGEDEWVVEMMQKKVIEILKR
jgi:hypothetical protein